MTQTRITLITAALAALVAAPAHAALFPNGTHLNGVKENGMSVNGWENGMSLNGFILNGIMPNAKILNGIMPNAKILNGIMPNGTAAKGTGAQSRLPSPPPPEVRAVVLPDGTRIDLR